MHEPAAGSGPAVLLDRHLDDRDPLWAPAAASDRGAGPGRGPIAGRRGAVLLCRRRPDGPGDRADQADCAPGHNRNVRRRDGHGQNPPGGRDPPPLSTPRPAVLDDQLRGAVGQPDRERDVRSRSRRLHRGRHPAHGQVRRRRPRHTIARRDRFAPPGASGQVVARRRGADVRGGRFEPDVAAPGPIDRGQQPPARARGGRRPVPLRPVLPAQRRRVRHPAATGAHGRRPGAGPRSSPTSPRATAAGSTASPRRPCRPCSPTPGPATSASSAT